MPTPMDCGISKDSNISKPGYEISEKSTENFKERIEEIDRELSRYDLSLENILAKNTCTGKENSLDALTINEINPSVDLQTRAIPQPYPTWAALADLFDTLNKPQVTEGTWKRLTGHTVGANVIMEDVMGYKRGTQHIEAQSELQKKR